MNAHAVPDPEVVELLADRPQLLAIADAIVATQPPRRRRRGRLLPRLLAAPLVAAAIAVAVLALPDGDGESSLVAHALAAIGTGPVVHARIQARLPETNVVELATGRSMPQTIAIEYWFDEPRHRLRTLVRRGGVVADEFLQTREGVTSSRGPMRLAPPAEPALDPALGGFVTRYRDALASGEARVVGEGKLDGRDVVWLTFAADGVRERVAVDAATYTPRVIRPLDANGKGTAFTWRVVVIETQARVEAEFAPPRRRPPSPFRGDVRRTRPLSSGQAAEAVAWPALWLGQSWRGLRLVSLELEALSRGYPPGSGIGATRGQGLRLRYGVAGRTRYVELSQAPFPEPAYAFAGGEATFNWNPIPAEGFVELVELAGPSPRAIAQLRRDDVYVTIWSSGRGLALGAARALRRIGR